MLSNRGDSYTAHNTHTCCDHNKGGTGVYNSCRVGQDVGVASETDLLVDSPEFTGRTDGRYRPTRTVSDVLIRCRRGTTHAKLIEPTNLLASVPPHVISPLTVPGSEVGSKEMATMSSAMTACAYRLSVTETSCKV